MGLDDVGRLAVGAVADFIRIDLDQPSFTPVTEVADLLAHLVWAGSSRSVTDVWVDGRWVVEAGVVQTLDVERAQAEVQQRGLRLVAG